MQLDAHVQALRDDLARVAAVGDEATARTAELLADALEPAAARRIEQAIAEAAVELSGQLARGRVEVRVAGGDIELVHVDDAPEGSPEPFEEAASARITLRLSDGLKARLEAAAAGAGVSVNSWIVQALARAVEPRQAAASGRWRLSGYGRA